MTIYAQTNLYTGVNPHLNSALQKRGTWTRPSLWEGFHSAQVGHIRLYLNRYLPPSYVAYSEQSLQSEKCRAVMIYEMTTAGTRQIVARIELVCPPNTTADADNAVYYQRRRAFIQSGFLLVEVDFLHESQPVHLIIPAYPGDKDSFPYYVIVSDPRPEHSVGELYGFGVGQKLPTVSIPLRNDICIDTNFDTIYQTHFEQDRLYTGVDYSLLPERFGTYRADDQARIRARMAEIAAGHPHNGATPLDNPAS